MLTQLRQIFFAGLFVLVPLGITIWVVAGVFSFFDHSLLLLPHDWRPISWVGYDIPGLGALLTFIIILCTGVVARNFLGGRMLHFSEYLLLKVPVIRSIYNSVKQVSDSLLSPNGRAFSKAVLVPFPNSQTLAIGFLTGSPGDAIKALLPAEEFVTVFIPTTPNPTSGFFIVVRQEDVIELPFSVDDALKYVVSMGVVNIDKKLNREQIAGDDLLHNP